MVTPYSIKKAFGDYIDWANSNPRASVKTVLKRLSRVIPEATEAKISLSTLPLILAPMPESAVRNIECKLRNRR